MSKKQEFIEGVCEQLLFSPEGGVEGVLIRHGSDVVQVSVDAETGPTLAHEAAAGKTLRLLGTRDHSRKAAHGSHQVYEFEAFADASGHAVKIEEPKPEETTIKGVVAKLHYARHGEPNGVMLAGGEFIHLRPDGMAKTALAVGSKVSATGEAGTTSLGTIMLEAHAVNGLALA